MEQKFPMAMLIRCYGCGEIFDVTIPNMEPHDYPCPACGRIEAVDLGAIQQKAIAWQAKQFRKPGGGR